MSTDLIQKSTFGAHPSEQDYRTVQSDAFAGAAAIPAADEISLNYPHVDELCDQRKLGVCTDCSVRMAAEECFHDGKRLSEYWGYLIGKIFFDKNLSEGSSAFTMLRAAYKFGLPEKDFVDTLPALKVDGTYAQFIASFDANFNGEIPQAVLDNAAKHKIPGYYEVKLTPLAIAAEIAGGRMVVLRLAAGENFYTAADGRTSWAAADILPLRAPKAIQSGHLMAANGYEGLGSKQLIKGPNSFSRLWGNNGYFSFEFDVQAPYFFTEAWAIDELPPAIVSVVKDLPEAKHFSHTFTTTILRGQSGTEVRALQILLSILGYLSIQVGELGIYGPKTAQAVYGFQVKNKVAPQAELDALAGGRVGPATIAKLNQMGAALGSI